MSADVRADVFRKCNIFTLPLRPEVAHDGVGHIAATRIVTGEDLAGACAFIDYVELPPGTSIGDHRHGADEEEFYLVLGGTGVMRLDDETFEVTAGDLVRNRPGGLHGLVSTGPDPLRLFVFEVEVHGSNRDGG
jgi:mannose-6-phosphate isomerase-like protein (cupin superfamily)